MSKRLTDETNHRSRRTRCRYRVRLSNIFDYEAMSAMGNGEAQRELQKSPDHARIVTTQFFQNSGPSSGLKA